MLAFTLAPAERFLMVHASFREGTAPRGGLGSARDVKKLLQGVARTMLGELGCSELEVLAVHERTFVLMVPAKQMRAWWFAVSCVESWTGGMPCVLRVVKSSSTLLGVSGSSRVGH